MAISLLNANKPGKKINDQNMMNRARYKMITTSELGHPSNCPSITLIGCPQ